MKKTFPIIFVLAIILLFFIQLAGTLVQSVYVLDLMNLNLDEKALGVLFFFTPVLLIPLYRRFPSGLVWACFLVLVLARGLLPYLNTAYQLIASGLGTCTGLSLFFLLIQAKPKGEAVSRIGLWGSAGLALAVSLSVLLRTVGYGLDYSLTPAGGWVGWLLDLLPAWLLLQLELGDQSGRTEKRVSGVTPAILGIFLILTLVWFAFSAPAVITRWTEGNYSLIVGAISLLSAGWVLLVLTRPQLFERITPAVLILWNVLFTLSLTVTILAHRVSFPPTPDSAPVVVTAPDWPAQIPLALMLLLFPVLFLDMRLFLDRIRRAEPAPRDLAPGLLLGGFVLVLLIFTHVFTNVWGYITPVSLPFRNMFWLPYFLPSALLTLLAWLTTRAAHLPEQDLSGTFSREWASLLAAIFLVTVFYSLPTEHEEVDVEPGPSLIVMTFNIQQANDRSAQQSYDRQLALMRQVSPDILALQESDSDRISLNNNDYVRYYAQKLGYFSYYGPTTVTGTFGTAILSRYPLLNTRAVFSYSDTDEIGTAEAEIQAGGRRIAIYDVHPDGSDTAKLVFARTLLQRSKDKPDVIALGDYNLSDDQPAYQLISAVYSEAWTSVYPSGIGAGGIDMSGAQRIDHIFVSPSLKVLNPVYVLPPASASDHPFHWAVIQWGAPY